eukprot:XP_001691773.1 predicted protein [Chlamydomonas reinhardtii]
MKLAKVSEGLSAKFNQVATLAAVITVTIYGVAPADVHTVPLPPADTLSTITFV